MSSNVLTHAQKEIDLLYKYFESKNDKPIIDEFVPEILALVDKFGNSGQSGGSAPYVANAISQAVKKLCMFETLVPITGEESEWVDIYGISDDQSKKGSIFQNNRCYGLFKENDVCYFIDAVVWKTEQGHTFTGPAITQSGEEISSKMNVKSFPFTPKTFVVDVIEKEIEKDNWQFYVKDDSQLNEVYEYYDKRLNG